jgi:hypothetical protein
MMVGGKQMLDVDEKDVLLSRMTEVGKNPNVRDHTNGGAAGSWKLFQADLGICGSLNGGAIVYILELS